MLLSDMIDAFGHWMSLADFAHSLKYLENNPSFPWSMLYTSGTLLLSYIVNPVVVVLAALNLP